MSSSSFWAAAATCSRVTAFSPSTSSSMPVSRPAAVWPSQNSSRRLWSSRVDRCPPHQGAPGALQLPVLDLPPANGLQLGQDLVPGLLVLAKLDAGGHQQQPLHLLQVGAGVVAQGPLLPHVQKQLGQRGGPEYGVAHHQGGVVLLPAGDPAGAEAQGQLALGHVHPLLLQAGLRPGVEAHLTVRLQPLL